MHPSASSGADDPSRPYSASKRPAANPLPYGRYTSAGCTETGRGWRKGASSNTAVTECRIHFGDSSYDSIPKAFSEAETDETMLERHRQTAKFTHDALNGTHGKSTTWPFRMVKERNQSSACHTPPTSNQASFSCRHLNALTLLASCSATFLAAFFLASWSLGSFP